MSVCVRSGCDGTALAAWWALCAGCTTPLLESRLAVGDPVSDQLDAATWEALDWAERIAPRHWGVVGADDPWVTSVRCLVLAAAVTGRGDGCRHTATSAATPVVAVARAPGVLRCPPCAEVVVASTTTDVHACDRCAGVRVTAGDRVGLCVASTLVVVAQLCAGCRAELLAADVSVAGLQ